VLLVVLVVLVVLLVVLLNSATDEVLDHVDSSTTELSLLDPERTVVLELIVVEVVTMDVLAVELVDPDAEELSFPSSPHSG
jgi:hypothetical protein